MIILFLRWLLFFGFIFFAFPQEFVPFKPEKPLRFCEEQKAWIQKAESDVEWVELKKQKNLRIHLPYATYNNITGHDLYCGQHRAFMHMDGARKLYIALAELQKIHPGYGFLIFDAGRPAHAQKVLYQAVQGTRWRNFIASPRLGSVHSYGMAVDLTIINEKGMSLDMGTPFDSFAPHSGKAGEAKALQNGKLTPQQVQNRELLRKVMRAAGFKRLDHEWWHFNAELSRVVREWYDTL